MCAILGKFYLRKAIKRFKKKKVFFVINPKLNLS